MSLEGHRCEFFVAYLDAGLVDVGVRCCSDGETSLGRGSGDEFDDRAIGDVWTSPPVHRDEAEPLVFDAVPFAGAGRVVTDGGRSAGSQSD